MKKNIASLIVILIVMSFTACSNKTENSEEATQNEQAEQESTEIEQENETIAEVEQEIETIAEDLPKPQDEISQLDTTIIESQNQDSAIELYVNVLRNYISAGKTDFTVSFINLNGDSTKEMVVFFGESQADGGHLFTIKNEEAIQVVAEGCDFWGQYGGFTYKEKENVFVTENESITDTQISNQISYYAIENGEVICKDVAQSISQFDSDESKFYVNDAEVDREKFDSIAVNYGLSEMSTVSYSDGVRVTNEQMDMVYNAYNSK